MITLIYFIIILGLIVLVHEGGHFLFAKLFGIYVYEFAIGMGPKIFSKKDKKGETSYSIRAIPIGGFVSLAGEEVDDDTSIPQDRKLYNKPAWQRFLVMFFGAGFNFIFAIFTLLLIGTIWGAPDTRSIISSVSEGYPADIAGIEQGDIVKSINGKKTSTSDDLALYMQLADKTKPIDFVIDRDGKEYKIAVNPVEVENEGEKSYVVGITMGSTEVSRGLVDTIKFTFVKTGSLFKQMFITFKSLFDGSVKVNDLSGPVGIYSVVGTYRESGFENILYLIALLSINVGFINLIPFPAFDGGRILFLIIEKIKGSPVSPKVENMVHSVGFGLLMALMVYITLNDILKLF